MSAAAGQRAFRGRIACRRRVRYHRGLSNRERAGRSGEPGKRRARGRRRQDRQPRRHRRRIPFPTGAIRASRGCLRRSIFRCSRRPASPSSSRCSSASSRSGRAAIRRPRRPFAKRCERLVGDDLSKLKPGSAEAMRLKEVLIVAAGLEPVSRSRHRPGCRGLHQGAGAVRRSAPAWMPACIRNRPGTIRSRKSCWWSSSQGRIVGATLGNDVNLRDFEGRSALLLSKAKDNNASCAVGPFVRLFDSSFSLDDVRKMDVTHDGRRARTASCSTAIPRSARSAAIRTISWRRPSDRSINIRTALRCSSAPCSRR